MKRKINFKNVGLLVSGILFVLVLITSFGQTSDEFKSQAFEACKQGLSNCDEMMHKVAVGNTVFTASYLTAMLTFFTILIFKLVDYLSSDKTSGQFKERLIRILVSEDEENEIELFLSEPLKTFNGTQGLVIEKDEYYINSNIAVSPRLIEENKHHAKYSQLKKLDSNLIPCNGKYTWIYKLFETDEGNKLVLTKKIVH